MNEAKRRSAAERVLAGEPVEYGDAGRWEADDTKWHAHPEGDVMVGRSVRMPMSTYERIMDVAADRRMSFSALVRQWIEDGLRAAEATHHDPMAEVRELLSAAQRALDEAAHTRAA